MQREIKFRAWDKNKKSYRTQQNLLDDICRFHHLDGKTVDVNLWRFIMMIPQQDNFILEQFTGLYDKNGKEIYEGDIASVYNAGVHHIAQIKWGNAIAGYYYYNNHTGIISYLTGGGDNYNQEVCEIIGNIHENPELLK